MGVGPPAHPPTQSRSERYISTHIRVGLLNRKVLDALLAEMQNEVFPNLFPKSKGRKFTGLPVITVLTKGLPYVNKIVLCYVKCCSSLPDFSGET